MPRHLPDGRESHIKTPSPGDIIYMVGGRVGSDGIHGATFSSLELTEESLIDLSNLMRQPFSKLPYKNGVFKRSN